MGTNALLKTLRHLECFQHVDGAMSVRELAELTGDSVSSVQRSTYTLEALGYLEREAGRSRYAPGRSCLRPAYGYLKNNRFLETATPYLIDLVERLDLRVDLTVLEGTDIVYLSRIPNREQLMNLSPLGQRWPAANTSPGKAILAAIPRHECDAVIDRTRFTALTPKTICDPARARAEIEETRSKGYGFQREEVLIGSCSVAAAVTGNGGRVLGAVAIGGRVEQFATEDERDSLGGAAIKVALAISAHNL